MRKYTSKSISFDPFLFARMEARLESLRPRINRSQYIEKLILDDLDQVDRTGNSSIVAENVTVYGGKIEKRVVNERVKGKK